ncbi:MAG: amidohydrolase family protein [Nakamurella sp.]
MLAIRATRMFDGQRFSAGGATVLTDGGQIVGVEEGFPDVGEQWQIINHEDATILPGLIDTHVHLVGDSGVGALDRVAGFTDDELDAVITEGLRCQLSAGVTTVRDLGDRRFSVLERRDRQRGGGALEPEPTILASGPPLTSPGGHCFYMGGEVAGSAGIEAAIAERLERSIDVVKVMASGGMTTPGTDVMGTQFSTDELRLIVRLAHDAGLPVTAHAHALSAVEQAVDVGVDGIEHCSCLTNKGAELSDSLLARLVESGVAVGAALGVPPASQFDMAPQAIKDLMRRAGVTPEGLRTMRLQTTGRMHRAGVRFVTGADSGINPHMSHGGLRHAASFLVEAGASTRDALAASTSVAAEVCVLGDRKGFLRDRYDADIIVVHGNAEADIEALQDVRSVILGGSVVR